MSLEGTSELSYLWRAATTTAHPQAKSKTVGEVGWNIDSHQDLSLIKEQFKEKRQLIRGEFRQLGEDRHTHLYQNPWTPQPTSDDFKKDRYGREILQPSNLLGRSILKSNKRCQCLANGRRSASF